MMTLKLNPLFILLAVFSFLVGSSHATQAATTYRKDHLSFKLPTGWVAKEDFRSPGTRRSIGVDTNGTSLILIDMYSKDVLLNLTEYQEHTSSLKQHAIRFNKHDLTAILKIPHPITQSKIQRKGYEGLKQTQNFIIGDVVNENSIREFYRIDVKDEIVFITMDTNENEYLQTAAGLELILGSFKYRRPK